jgi:hypothetical protein
MKQRASIGTGVALFAMVLGGAACKAKTPDNEAPAVNPERPTPVELKKAEAQMQVASQQMAAAMQKASAEMAQGMAEMNKGLAGSGAGGQAALVDFRALKALLPGDLAGLARKSASGEKAGAMGFGVSKAEGTYQGSGGSRLDVRLLDGGAMATLAGAVGLMGMEIDKETDDGYERTTKIDGWKALEKYDGRSKRGEVKVFVGGRYLVEIDGEQVTPEIMKKAIADLDFAHLAALK